MGRSTDIGGLGERLVAAFLVRRGFAILRRNFRVPGGEIDLVVFRRRLVAFVEVKTRTGRDGDDVLASVGWRKRAWVRRAARRWVADHGVPGDAYRFDVAVVRLGARGTARLTYLPDAW